jgi:hypothetical protein
MAAPPKVKNNPNFTPDLPEIALNPRDRNRRYTVKPEYLDFVPHSKIARLNGTEMKDIIELMHDMTKPERETFVLLKRSMNYRTNVAKLNRAKLTSSQQRSLASAYTALHSMGIVKRVAQNTYLLSPYHFIPSANAEKHQELVNEWESL